jgi:hypothetical protein
MKLYKRTFFLLTCLFIINNSLGYTQNVGYVRIIDNTDKSNDYKDCQYNRFDDLLINNMMKKGINVTTLNEKTIQSLLNSQYSGLYILKSKFPTELRKLKRKLNLDYIIYFSPEKYFHSNTDIPFPRLECGSDIILKNNSDGYAIGFGLLALNENIENKIILKIKGKKDNLDYLTAENFNDQTSVDNFIKDILDITKKNEVNKKKSDIKKSELKLTNEKSNNNSISNISSFSNPRIMVLPKKIDEKNYQNGEYYLKKEEKMIIASLKKVLEDNKLKTIGFESVIKNLSERRLLQSGTKVDLKTLILESNEADFYVEFENLDDGVMLNQNNGNCPKSFDFKIRNYATGEDIASDLQEINTCGSIDEYKKFANKILNNGAITKINDEFQYLVENGKKISIFFSFSNSSNKKFDDKIQGLRISQHIEKSIKENAFNGKFIFGGVVNNYISFPQVSVPFIDKNNNQLYTVPQFSNAIRDYLENYLEVKEVTVTGSSINFILN